MSYTQSHPRAFEALLKMESVDMTDDEYMGGLGTRSMSKVKYPTYRQPIPYPSLLKRPPSSSQQTYSPVGGPISQADFNPGFIRGMNTFGEIM